VVLYELFTGERMFHGEDAAETLAAVIHKQPDLERVPPQVRKLLRRCLEKDPRQRLRDIGEARYLLDEPTAPASARSRSRFSSAVIAALAVIAAGAGWIAWRATRPMERPLMQLSAELGPDTSLALLAGGSIALSPDGTLLALTVRGADGQVRLGTRRIDASKINILAGTEGAQAPFFSPDGRWIAFSNSGGLQKISAQGGAPVSLSNTFSLGGSWGDDSIVSYLRSFPQPELRPPYDTRNGRADWIIYSKIFCWGKMAAKKASISMIDPLAKVYDGFLVPSRFGNAGTLENASMIPSAGLPRYVGASD
jgi:serine/threonine-protein kinase